MSIDSQLPLSDGPRESRDPHATRPPSSATLRAAPFAQRLENQFSITIQMPVPAIYAFWRNFQNFPLFMKDLTAVEVLSPTRSRWTVQIKAGLTSTWTAEIVEDIPYQLISWQSEKDSPITTKGTVQFLPAPAGRGTMVLLAIDYLIPGGRATELLTKLSGEDPVTLVKTNLKRLKALLETGEIPTTEGQPSGREGRKS